MLSRSSMSDLIGSSLRVVSDLPLSSRASSNRNSVAGSLKALSSLGMLDGIVFSILLDNENLGVRFLASGLDSQLMSVALACSDNLERGVGGRAEDKAATFGQSTTDLQATSLDDREGLLAIGRSALRIGQAFVTVSNSPNYS
jgi:hypothetical protein